MKADDFFRGGDEEHLISLRRELHMYPEIDFDLPRTVALVKRELSALDIPFTEEFGRSAVVAFINPEISGAAIGIRADMDALPITETATVPYVSKNQGRMHACGHDAHTAILLAAARALKRAESSVPRRVKLIFQPSEEGRESGAKEMAERGVMDDIDVVIGLHVEPEIETGHIGVCDGASMAARHRYCVEFFGKSAHAAFPQDGHDALAMAVKTYNGLHVMISKEIDPMQRRICSINALNAGVADNIIPDYAKMLISARSFELELDGFIRNRIERLARNAAEELGGTAKVAHEIEAYPVNNDPGVCEAVREAARRVVGREKVVDMPVKMSSEDFSFFLARKPGCFFGLGIRNEKIGCKPRQHSGDFTLDETALIAGSKVFVQFVLDNASIYKEGA